MMMKKMTAILAAALVLLMMLGGAALADSTITVTGKATVQLQPDMARVTLGVTAVNEEVLKAQQEINIVLGDVVAALTGEEMGIAPEDIATVNYYIFEKYEYNYETGASEMVGYEANASLAILVRDIDQAGAVIDAAMQAGANQLNGIEFLSSDQTAARDEALTLAVQDGARKAGVIASAAGVQLPKTPDSITEVTDYSYETANTVYTMAREDSAAGATQLQAGMLNLTATVTITYEID